MAKEKLKIKERTLYQKIVNFFISIFIAFLFLVFLFFGISQTSTFREYLRKTVVNEVNNSINGRLSIEKIDGTLLTSLYLRNVVITAKKDTLLKAETIELKTSPLQLLFKKLLIRKLELKNSKIELIKYKNGNTNLDNIFNSTDKSKETKPKPFPFIITISNVVLNNVQFYLHDSDFRDSEIIYDSLTTQNLNIKNINASLSVNLDLNRKFYDLVINSFSCKLNVYSLSIKNIESHITIDNEKLLVKKLQVETSNSNFVINGWMKKNKLLYALENNLFGNAAVNLNLKSERLDLNEIGKLVPSILPIDGIVNVELNANGKFNDLAVNKLKIGVGKSHLHIKGRITELDNLDSINIEANIYNSILYADEISEKLTFLNLPLFKELKEIKIDTLSFRGREFGFISNFKITYDEGNIFGNIQMNFLSGESVYYGEIKTQNISLYPILKVPVKLNSKINIFGTGTDFLSMNSTININANNSFYNNIKFDVLTLSSNIKNGKVIYQIDAVSDLTSISATGNILWSKVDNLKLDIKAELENFNISDFSNDSSLVTNLNLIFTGNGIINKKGEFNLSSNLKLKNSYINNTLLDSNNFKIIITGNNDYISKLNINSNKIDAKLKGRFSINNITNIVVSEINSLKNVINKEIAKITFTEDTLLILSQKNKRIVNDKINLSSNDSLNFSIRFKQFNLRSPFIGSDNINISGLLKGSITNKSDSIKIFFNSSLDYVKIWGKTGVYFLSNLSLDVNLINTLGFANLTDLIAGIKLNTKRVFAGSDIKNIKLNYKLKNGKGIFSFNADIENKLKINIKGETIFNDLTSTLKINQLNFMFKKYLIKNEGELNLLYSKGKINFNNFLLTHGNGRLKISGSLNKNKNHQLLINVNKINLSEIANNILNGQQFKNINGVIGFNASIGGNYSSPEIELNLSVNNISVGKHKVGNLKSKLNYLNKNLTVDLSITDLSNSLKNPILSIAGSIPIDLSLNKINNRLLNNVNTNVKVTANNFNLFTISNFIPEFTNVSGILFADLDFKGKLNNLLPTGSAIVKNISFISDFNNMEYNAFIKFSADNGVINLDSMYLANIEGTKDGGVLTGFGNTKFKNYRFTSQKVFLNGQLKILNNASKAVSPLVYGDLVVATRGKAEFIIDSNKEYLKAPLLVKRANITFAQAKPSFTNTRSNFIYKYVSDTINVDKDISSFDNLIKLSRQRDSSRSKKSQSTDNLVFDVDIKVEDEASITFVLDKEFNQILNANISGNFQYKTVEGTPRAFGTLTLREGSTLEFLTKTFEAEGTLRFENELANPYLDVVGIYRDYYYEPTIDSINTTSQEREVAVKVKLKGPLQDLNKNFVKTKDNLAVYYGTSNIDKDIPDLTKDASDAIMFIVTGHFTTTGEGFINTQQNALTGTASIIASSLIGGLLNSYAGDYIRSVELKQVGSYTKFSLSGKVNKFKYTIGGTTEVFQDLSRTNVRIEYPFFQKFFIRVERKEALTESSLLREMINELGIKYKFEF
ncbi:MAG: hypothetical protein IIA48_04450 [Bacteroidetes bacterium]|nr:hypothetical protein [Bacteroidota bacterium]